MYNTSIVCTYNTPDVFIEEELIELHEQEIYFIRNAIYRQELLNILDVDDYNDMIFDDKFVELYEHIKGHKGLRRCMRKAAESISISDEIMGLIILYSYDHMYLTHLCVSEYINNGNINEDLLNQLESKL